MAKVVWLSLLLAVAVTMVTTSKVPFDDLFEDINNLCRIPASKEQVDAFLIDWEKKMKKEAG